jgi:NAD(P)-dependent dehydrogenase (short-subunit alcohol dehydrogenase family)
MASKLFDLAGKTAVVVGGTSGIGLAMAIGLAEAGADVIATSRRAEQVEQAAAAIEAAGGRTLRHTCQPGETLCRNA